MGRLNVHRLLLDVNWLLLHVHRRLLVNVSHRAMRMVTWWVLNINSCIMNRLLLLHIRGVTWPSVCIILITHLLAT